MCVVEGAFLKEGLHGCGCLRKMARVCERMVRAWVCVVEGAFSKEGLHGCRCLGKISRVCERMVRVGLCGGRCF